MKIGKSLLSTNINFAGRSPSSRTSTHSRFGNSTSRSEVTGFRRFVHSILPPPPDSRVVQFKSPPEPMEQPEWLNVDVSEVKEHFGVAKVHVQRSSEEEPKEQVKKNMNISNLNTTLIGDYAATVFPEYNTHWLVQATGNATFESVIKAINDGLLIADRRYVFVMLGGNQLRAATKTSVFRNVMEMVVAIRDRAAES